MQNSTMYNKKSDRICSRFFIENNQLLKLFCIFQEFGKANIS